MSTAAEVAHQCIPTAHPAIKVYVNELEQEIKALRRQLRSVIASRVMAKDRLIEAACRARDLEREHDCETDDWWEADGVSVNYSWPHKEAYEELEKRIESLQIGLDAEARNVRFPFPGPNPDPDAPF